MKRTLPRPIARMEILRPGMPLTRWYAAQADKPDILLNASLYDGIKPCGTVIENGKLRYNAGTGYGLGVLPDGTPGMGDPWKGWSEYLSAYYAIVREGKAQPEPWKDAYVFGSKNTRIAIGREGDQWSIYTGDGLTIRQFAAQCVREGAGDVCNLDGGGSRALLWLGVWLYTSTRTPYNAIAIWLEPETETKKENDSMKVKCTATTQTYNAAGIPESGRHIDKGDVCTLSNILLKTMLVQITYPVPGGTRTAYIRDIANFTLA